MEQNKYKTISKIFSFAIVGLILSAIFVSAYQGNPTVEGPNFTDERHEAMQNAFDNLNYEEWYNLMIQDERIPGVLRKINENNFATFVEMRNAMISGDTQTVDELRAELGMGQGRGNHGQNKRQGNNGQYQQRENSQNCPYMS